MKTRCFQFLMLSIVTVGCLMSCGRDDDNLHKQCLISWSGGVSLFTVNYSIDGRNLGSGRDAYKALITSLESLSDGQQLTFRCPRDVIESLFELTGIIEPLPFNGFEDERASFNSMRTKKRFGVTIDSYE